MSHARFLYQLLLITVIVSSVMMCSSVISNVVMRRQPAVCSGNAFPDYHVNYIYLHVGTSCFFNLTMVINGYLRNKINLATFVSATWFIRKGVRNSLQGRFSLTALWSPLPKVSEPSDRTHHASECQT